MWVLVMVRYIGLIFIYLEFRGVSMELYRININCKDIFKSKKRYLVFVYYLNVFVYLLGFFVS